MKSDNASKNRARGGKARALATTPEQRQEIARKGAEARWANANVPSVEYGSDDRPLRIGGIDLACYVLNDPGHTRVFSQGGLLQAIGLANRGGELKRYLDHLGAKSSLAPEVIEALENPMTFRPPGGGRLANGFRVELLIDLCNFILERRLSWPLPTHYQHTAIRAETIVKAVAKTGIIALVDEATGYDEKRSETLQHILNQYLRQELAAWSRRFPTEFYKQIFRLRNWEWSGARFKTPGVVAHYTKDLIYARLAPSILTQLETRNPITTTGRRRFKHHQFLSDEVGIPALDQHLFTIISFMRAAESWPQLISMVDRALPRLDESMQLDLIEWARTVSLSD